MMDNPATGPATVLVLFPEGHRESWDSHSSTYRSVSIKGDFRTRSKNQDET